ncbi:beta-tubulin cofactor d [Venturia nashicola]|uniref:Beta-tubulin cofactor d n=1 Tax=Venturia nashicola TaxID=86259 RepID=A0A4Z1P9L7_9PEZI|nr:beta-tubulin cofactor d [Venturia nashicola]
MEAAEDDELQLLRISEGLVADLQRLLRIVLWKKPAFDNADELKVHRIVKLRDLERLIQKIEPFQQEPQLLDVQLKNIIPHLVTAYLESRGRRPVTTLRSGHATVQYAIFKILYTFCKVRGEKVIVGFFNNEPRYLEPLLSDFERGSDEMNVVDAELLPTSLSWEGRYILLLWLSHLMLSPFDLATMSSVDTGATLPFEKKLQLPSDTPGIAMRVLPICLKHLKTATRERNAASQLLVRLCLRPDMRDIGLLDAVAQWAIDYFSDSAQEVEIHKSLGVLAFVSGLVASGSQREIGHFVGPIFKATQRLAIEEDDASKGSGAMVKSSAVARKLFVKIFRNIVILCLQAPSEGIDTTSIVEDVIGILLETLADGDTPVRFAASKALSMITLKLDPSMAAEIVEALLDSLNEDVLLESSRRDVGAVNPLRWHGLTLTLSHLLYRRAVSTDQLPHILNALLLALTFEQRSATGAAIGTNVRDAANFGIWAIARRYTTDELQKVDLSDISAVQGSKYNVTITQMLAVELIQCACLDPAGNIRRGSSAVLQELVGRHPDTIIEGISLIQIVDFHAVGLRQRAIADVTFEAAKLSPMYWDALFQGLLDWRGTGAVDEASRVATAHAIGKLSATQSSESVHKMLTTIRNQLKGLATRQVEERHGLMLAVAAILTQEQDRNEKARRRAHLPTRTNGDNALDRSDKDTRRLKDVFSILHEDLTLNEKDFISPFLRPALTATAWLKLFRTLLTLDSSASDIPKPMIFMQTFNLCLGRGEESVLAEIPDAVNAFTAAVSADERDQLVKSWLSYLLVGTKMSHARSAGRVLALGAAMGLWAEQLADWVQILEILTMRCTTETSIEERVDALKSLKLVVLGISELQLRDTILRIDSNDCLPPAIQQIMISTAHAALRSLNDYTVDDRGDTGSLVRLEALDLVEAATAEPLFFGWHKSYALTPQQVPIAAVQLQVSNATVRLSLERLDKVRARAWRHGTRVIEDYSSYEYFRHSLQSLHGRLICPPNPKNSAIIENEQTMCSFFEGYCSSAGGLSSESLAQVSRAALYDYLDSLDLEREPNDGRDLPPTLLEVCNTFCNLVRSCLGNATSVPKKPDNDRVLVPVLEVIAFLLDVQIIQRLPPTQFKYLNLLSLIQKSHFKSTNTQKLHAALNIYRSLGNIPSIQSEVIKKVTSMLVHPFPSIRASAAETLFMITGIRELKPVDWTQDTKVLRGVVDGFKQQGIL